MDAQAQTWILVGAGAVVKFLRGYKWFGDWLTVVVGVGAAVIMALISQPADISAFFSHFGTDIQTVLATLGAGHYLAKMTGGKVLPVNDQFATPTGGK